jgi:hypothetical protein
MAGPRRSRLCPNDAARIPLVAEHRDWPSPAVRFFWCPWCAELFAFVGENELGGRFAGSFAYDRARRQFVPWKTGREPRDVGLAEAALPRLVFTPDAPGKDATDQGITSTPRAAEQRATAADDRITESPPPRPLAPASPGPAGRSHSRRALVEALLAYPLLGLLVGGVPSIGMRELYPGDVTALAIPGGLVGAVAGLAVGLGVGGILAWVLGQREGWPARTSDGPHDSQVGTRGEDH